MEPSVDKYLGRTESEVIMATYTENLNLEKPSSTDFIDVSVLNENMDAIDAAISARENKATITASTIYASGWTNKTYSFETTYPNSTYNLEIAIADTASTTQLDAYNSAQLASNATSNVVKALGVVPTVDIPIVIKVVKK